jgi:hypothetical protein
MKLPKRIGKTRSLKETFIVITMICWAETVK